MTAARAGLLAAGLLLALLRAGAAEAQDPRGRARAAGDTVPRPAADTVPGDTLPADSAARPAPPPDSLYRRLLTLPGYVPVEYRADSAQFRADERTLRLYGGSQVTSEGRTLTAADSIVYRERRSLAEVYGEPTVTGEGEEIVGNVMYYDLDTRRALVRGGRTQVAEQGVEWFVEGDFAQEQGERIYARGSTFTSDDRPEPAYHFRTGRIKIIRDRILVGRPAVLYFRNVPVFALPFIVQDLERGRRSGLLTPEFELNDIVRTRSRGGRRGTGREISNVGFYWAINDYLGAQVAGAWRSESWTSLTGDLSFRWRREFLEGRLAYRQFWQEEGSDQRTISGSASWQPTERTQLSGNVDFASSSDFVVDHSTDPYEVERNLSSNLTGRHTFDWGTLNLTGQRQQSLADGDVTTTFPSGGLTVNPITLFRAPEGAARWYNNVVYNLSLTGSRGTVEPGDPLSTRRPDTETRSASVTQTLRIGGLSINSGVNYNRSTSGFLAGVDTTELDPRVQSPEFADPLAGSDRSTLTWNAGTSYQLPLIATTTLNPSISLSQEFVRKDTLIGLDKGVKETLAAAYGQWVAAPTRLNFGTSLNTDLFGFFPGFGPYQAIRHHLTPRIDYRYSPAVEQTRLQELAFGPEGGRTINEITLGLNQTFEAKLRPERAREEADTTLASDSAAAEGVSTPQDPQKVTLLSISTGAVAYSFVRKDSTALDPRGRHFLTDQISNTVTSDLLGGLRLTFTHDLFAERQEGAVGDSSRVRREFSPFLTNFSTGIRLGRNSALFRFLGLAGPPEREVDGEPQEEGMIPDTAGAPPVDPRGAPTATGNVQTPGAGDWSLSLDYSLRRSRPTDVRGFVSRFDRDDQEVRINLSLNPTRNWQVTWNTGYSLSDGSFNSHQLSLVRDLYRWRANLSFNRTVTGNTSFSFRVNLTDLPDLKFDYNERNLGVEREQDGGTRSGSVLVP